MTDLRKDMLTRLAMLWRRRWAGLALVWIVCLIGWSAVLLWPSQFRSQALIYVDTDTLLGPLLKDLTVANDTQHQVPLIMRTLLSRPNLHKVAVATDLALATQSPVDEVNLYERMEKAALITVQGTNLLAISYTDENPVLARDVVQALLSVLVDNSTLQNRSDMDKALDFVEKQIATYEEKLRFIESRMADFKRQHGDVLVSSDSNLGARKDSLRDAVSTAQGQVAELKDGIDLLTQQIRTVPQFLNVENAPQVIVNDSRGDQARILELQRTVDNLRLLYTDQHPDVITAVRQLDLMRGEASDPKAADQQRFRSQLANPVYEQLQIRLFEQEQQLSLTRSHLASARAAQSQLDVMSAENPTVVAQYTDLIREYDVLKKQYDELLVRREAALMSQAVENTSQKIQFRVVEPPRIPAKPFGPPRLWLLAAVLLVALLGWPGLALLMDKVALPVTSAEDLARHSSLPLLGIVSKIRTRQDVAREVRWNFRFAGASLSLFLLFGGLFLITLHRSGLLGNHGVVESRIGGNHVG